MKVLAVNDYAALQVETDEQDWPSFRRYRADVWEVCVHDSWEPVDCPDQLLELEKAFQKFMREENVTSKSGKIVEVDMLQDVGIAEITERMKEQLRKLKAEASMSTLRTPEERCIEDFEWKAAIGNEMAQIKEALEYLAWIGEVFYPWWDWKVYDPVYSSLFQRDRRGLKVRQWRGRGFSTHGLLTNGGKWGVILVISEEALVRLWHGSPERKLEIARQITRETIEHTVIVAEGCPYPEFVPNIQCEEAEEEACGNFC